MKTVALSLIRKGATVFTSNSNFAIPISKKFAASDGINRFGRTIHKSV